MDIQKELEKYPLDYFKAIELLKNAESPEHRAIIFRTIYEISRNYIPKEIYKYYSFTDDSSLNELKLDTLYNKKVYLSEYSSFNDPFDNQVSYYEPEKLMKYERLRESKGRIFDDRATYTRICSFTKAGNNNMPMWAHYSNNHSGYCVMYDTSDKDNLELKSTLFPIQYTDSKLDITDIIEELVIEGIEKLEKAKITGEREIPIDNMTIVLATTFLSNIKQSHWSYEKEIRCSVGNIFTHMDAKPHSIFIGMNCPDEYRNRLINIGLILDLEVYVMEFDKDATEYKLISKRVL